MFQRTAPLAKNTGWILTESLGSHPMFSACRFPVTVTRFMKRWDKRLRFIGLGSGARFVIGQRVGRLVVWAMTRRKGSFFAGLQAEIYKAVREAMDHDA